MLGRPDAGERLARRLASSHTRRGFLGRLGAGAIAAVSGRLAASAVAPDTAEARYYGFCGHTYTTHHCPGPYFPPRIDRHGRPLRPRDGHRVDNLGRLVNRDGYVVDEQGNLVRGPTGEPVPRAASENGHRHVRRPRIAPVAVETKGANDVLVRIGADQTG